MTAVCEDGDSAPAVVRLAMVQGQPLACDFQFPLYPAGISHNLEGIIVVFCLFASHSSSSLPSAALYSPAVTVSLTTTSSTDLSPQIPSSIVSHYLLGLTKANTFSLHCPPSSHSSPSPSFPFFSAAPCLPKAFPMLCFIG